MRKSIALLSLTFALLALAVPALAAEEPAVSLDQIFAADSASCAVPASGTVEVEQTAPGLDGIFQTGILFPTQCNQAVCGPDEFCCNYSCSTCAPRGGYCLDIVCPPIS